MEAEARVSDEGMRIVEHATCLGCGCTCDDITVVVRLARIAEARHACPLGLAWFGDGQLPARVISGGHDVDLDRALDDAAALLGGGRALVYLAGDLSCEVQRAGVAVADQLHAALDTLTTATALPGILAAQRRGRGSATLGEIRNRADVLVFWGVDPARDYPRYTTRYALDPEGIYIPGGRRDRKVIAVDIGETRAIADADERVHFTADEEIAALSLMRAAVLGRPVAGTSPGDLATRVLDLVRLMTETRYLAVVADGEGSPTHEPGRAEALVTLTQALNGPTRCALSTLRAGNNRSGADAVLTWQTGFPLAVDFARGVPRYRPDDGAAALLARHEIDIALVLGNAATIPSAVTSALANVACAVIGPRASESTFGPRIAIDTGVAGIHEGGMAMRMDDVPLPLRPSIAGPTDTLTTVNALARRLGQFTDDGGNSGSGRPGRSVRAGRPHPPASSTPKPASSTPTEPVA